ncbi:uncharacterized protein LOC127847541 [Dreissena polymorpha]|uniref:uncharacterized protein LOC127847541 n=1 Tax=Dreissena polymorpha TaxID=45954 RepID=UPI0022649F72|nr:uncharacterized protein LOC127847541 [Dreissena polymorpha]
MDDFRWICVMVLFTGLVESQVPPNLSCYSPRPFSPSCIDKYAAFPGHLNCEYGPFSGRPLHTNDTEQAQIAYLHNKIRARVSPTASDMTKLKENSGLGSTAERFARRCTADSTWYQRAMPGGFLVGQNHLYSNTALTWTDVIRKWESENTTFVYGSTGNNPSLVGNYTQIVSSETSSVGCGSAQCSGFYLYICLYAPMLDPVRINKPYKKSNKSCDDCPGKCNGTLCDYGGLICLSGSKLNMTTFRCDCVSTVRPGTYNDSVCFLNCINNTDSDPDCSGSLIGTCGKNIDTMFRCPWMCNVCPYSDRNWNPILISKMPWEKGLPDCTTTPPPTTTTTTTTTTATTLTASTSRVTQTSAGHSFATSPAIPAIAGSSVATRHNSNAQLQNGGIAVAFASELYIGCTIIMMLNRFTS